MSTLPDFYLKQDNGEEASVWSLPSGHVYLALHDPFYGVSNTLTPNDARRVAAALIAHADAIDGKGSVPVTSNADDFGGLPG